MTGIPRGSVEALRRGDSYKRARVRAYEGIDEQFGSLRGLAVRALRAGLEHEDAVVALGAAKLWFQVAGYGEFGKAMVSVGVTAEDVARRLMALAGEEAVPAGPGLPVVLEAERQ
jgi:hypothetical protein